MNASITRYLLCLLVMVVPASAMSVTIVECKETSGDLSFRDLCPPYTVKMGEKYIRGGPHNDAPTVQDIAKEYPVVLYTVPKCDACDLVRQQLNARAVPYAEKDVSSDPANQEALRSASGAVTVPTVSIGAQIFTGYSRSGLDMGLNQAGYPAAPAATAEAAEQAPK